MPRSPLSILTLISIGAIALSGCADTSLGNALENAFAADTNTVPTPAATPSDVPPTETETATLPTDFPDSIPLYPEASLTRSDGDVVRWTSPDPSNAIVEFYRDRLSQNNWEIVRQNDSAIVAQRDTLQATVAVDSSSSDVTEIAIAYETIAPGKDETKATPEPTETTPEIEVPTTTTSDFSDLDETPDSLKTYVEDVAKLDILTAAEGDQFAPSQPITRREFARWLFAANNTIYANRSGYQIRPGDSGNPAFQDVPASDRDFAAIQGLAEAGIVPSPLSGAATTVEFNPDEPLSREDFLLWKVPLDLRRGLPTATIESVQQTWGFQDVSRIDPQALRAVLADFQSGELSNIRRSFGYTTLFQPKKAVDRAEAAAGLWYFGNGSEGRSAKEVLEQRDAQ